MIGCRPAAVPPHKPLPVPTSLVSVDHFLGTPLSGPGVGPTTVPSDDPAGALDVRVTLIALEKIPASDFTPLGSRATLMSATGSRNALLPAEELTRNIQVVDPKDTTDFPALLRSAGAGRLRQIAALAGALPPGVTADFSAADPDSILDPITAAQMHRSLRVMVSRSTDTSVPPRVALLIKDQAAATSPQLRTEQAMVELSGQPNSITGFIVPFRFDHAESSAVGILVSISPGTTDAVHVAANTLAINQITAHLARPRLEISSGQAGQDATIAAAIAGMNSPSHRRTSLALLANQTHASLAEDIAMEASDATLQQVVESAKIPPGSQPSPTLGWQLDRAALAVLARQFDAAANSTNGAKLPDELAAVLTAHTGEVGRHPSSLNDVLTGSNSRADFDNRLIAENTIYLEDGSPASRVRAFDWLKSHGHEPVGFDPLAPAKQRQKQLEHALNPPTSEPINAPTGAP